MGKSEKLGFHIDTHLANIPSDNTWQDSWERFYSRLMRRMMDVEAPAHEQDVEYDALKEGILNKVIPRLLRPLETEGRSILIHSDLWPGNCMPDADTDQIMFFDSCAFWGHNEAKLGSWRAPRYWLGKPYLKEYQRVMGISEPCADWDDRNALYAMLVSPSDWCTCGRLLKHFPRRYDLLVSALYPNSAHGLQFRDL